MGKSKIKTKSKDICELLTVLQPIKEASLFLKYVDKTLESFDIISIVYEAKKWLLRKWQRTIELIFIAISKKILSTIIETYDEIAKLSNRYQKLNSLFLILNNIDRVLNISSKNWRSERKNWFLFFLVKTITILIIDQMRSNWLYNWKKNQKRCISIIIKIQKFHLCNWDQCILI